MSDKQEVETTPTRSGVSSDSNILSPVALAILAGDQEALDRLLNHGLTYADTRNNGCVLSNDVIANLTQKKHLESMNKRSTFESRNISNPLKHNHPDPIKPPSPVKSVATDFPKSPILSKEVEYDRAVTLNGYLGVMEKARTHRAMLVKNYYLRNNFDPAKTLVDVLVRLKRECVERLPYVPPSLGSEESKQEDADTHKQDGSTSTEPTAPPVITALKKGDIRSTEEIKKDRSMIIEDFAEVLTQLKSYDVRVCGYYFAEENYNYGRTVVAIADYYNRSVVVHKDDLKGNLKKDIGWTCRFDPISIYRKKFPKKKSSESEITVKKTRKVEKETIGGSNNNNNTADAVSQQLGTEVPPILYVDPSGSYLIPQNK